MDLSIVVPCYNEEGSLPLLFSAVDDAFATSGVSYELVLVNDGSSDGTSTCCMSCPLLHRPNVSSWSIFPATSARKAHCSQAFNMPKGMRLA